MATMRITATEGERVIARFDNTDDAMVFAEAITRGNDRRVSLSDRAGWVSLNYANGITTDIR